MKKNVLKIFPKINKIFLKTPFKKKMPLKSFLFLFSCSLSLFSCSSDVETIFEKLNTPLGLKIEIHSDGVSHLISFYADNRGKQGFYGYAMFEGATLEESRVKYKESDAVAVIQTDPNRDVDIPIQVKIGGTDSVAASGVTLTTGNYLTVRAVPYYADNRKDNIDPQKGPTLSHPSNTVLIP